MRMSGSKLLQFRMREVRSTLLVLLSAKTRFAPLDVILYAAYSAIQVVLLHESCAVMQHGDFSAIQNGTRRPYCHFDLRSHIEHYGREYWRESYSCDAFTRRYRFHLFRNVARNTFDAVPFFLDLFFRTKFVSVPYRAEIRIVKCGNVRSFCKACTVGTFRCDEIQ